MRYAAIDAVLSLWACSYLHGMAWESPGKVDLAALCPGKELLAGDAAASKAKAKAKAGKKSKKPKKGGKDGDAGDGDGDGDGDGATALVDPKKKAKSDASKNSFFVFLTRARI